MMTSSPWITAPIGVITPESGSDVTSEVTRAEAAEALLAPKVSPALTGTPTAPTPTAGDNSTKIATTAFVAANGGGGTITGINIPGKGIIQGQVESLTPLLQRRIANIDPTKLVATNAPSALTIATPDASGQVVEPAVEYVASGWNGHQYWALITGYTNSNASTENPSLYYSDDGITFTSASAGTFPIVTAPAGGNNDDPEILLGPDGKMHLFWCAQDATNSYIYWCTSSDGVTVTTPVAIYTQVKTVERAGGFSVIWDGENNQWIIIYGDTHGSGAVPLKRRTIAGSSPNGTMSAATTCTLTGIGAGRSIWETHVCRVGAQLVMLTTFCDASNLSANCDLHFGYSNDNGLTWTFNTNPVLTASTSGWDNGEMYRADLVPIDGAAGEMFRIWYSAKNAGGVWKMGTTTAYGTVSTVDGVAINGTPTTGQVPTATSGSTAVWQTPSAGGAGSLTTPLVTIDPRGAKGDNQAHVGTWTIATDTNNNAIYLYNSSAVVNDSMSWQVALQAGTYTLTLIYLAAASSGIATVEMDGTSVGTVDMYNAATSGGNVGTVSGIVIATDGVHTLQLLAASKNASASAFRLPLQSIQLRRTA